MNEDRRKMLTEKVLGKCRHEYAIEKQPDDGCGEFSCWVCRCGHKTQFWQKQRQNPTFTTRDDMMDLYRAIHEKGLWERFYQYTYSFWLKSPYRDYVQENTEFASWLFCLSGTGYDARCEMVAEFFERRYGKEIWE